MNEIGIIFIIAVIFITGGIVLYERGKIRRTVENLNIMLDAVIADDFSENTFDETKMSALESKLYDYLSAAKISAQNIAVEKDKIKELISDISHQTKTPIANVLLYAQLLAEQDLPEESISCVDALNNQAEKLNFLIASLVKLSRLETGVLQLNPVQNNLREVFEKLNIQFSPIAENKNIKLTFESSDAIAIFDLKWTEEALGNIIDNAIKYTQSDGNINVRVKPYELFCRVDISDNGIGISESEHEKIFSRFFRSAKSGDEKGVGIGLYLTKQILFGQGGYIKVSSEIGKGSVFSVFLPMPK